LSLLWESGFFTKRPLRFVFSIKSTRIHKTRSPFVGRLVGCKAVPYSSTKQKQNRTPVLFCLCFVRFVMYVPTSCRQKQISIHIQQRWSNIQNCSWYSLCEDDNSRIEHPIVEVFDKEGYSNVWWSVDFDTESGVQTIFVTVLFSCFSNKTEVQFCRR
jgi:hypothetical protein